MPKGHQQMLTKCLPLWINSFSQDDEKEVVAAAAVAMADTCELLGPCVPAAQVYVDGEMVNVANALLGDSVQSSHLIAPSQAFSFR